MSQHDPAALTALTAELRGYEERILDPTVRADPARVRALLAPDFTEFGASGRVFDRDGILAVLAAEGPREARQARGFKVRLLAPGAALTTWRVKRDDGIETLRSSVWQQQDGRWLMVFHQGTLAAHDDEGTL
ncbi:MAG: nuclear transport factor 2 family protein [Aquabacterium sp.]|nr:nuclear transport factor 2 family protein [Aquabacterium sp.]